jgi:hypothetical protein
LSSALEPYTFENRKGRADVSATPIEHPTAPCRLAQIESTLSL